MRCARHGFIVLIIAGLAPFVEAQSPAKPAPGSAPTPPASAPSAPTPPPAAAAPAGSGAATPAAAVAPQEAYAYRADGRRDPFLNLVGLGAENKLTSRKGEGVTGLTVGEISVRGVVQSRGGLVAMIQGPDHKTYIVHQGDKLLDGAVKSVTAEGLVIVQEVNDPLSLIKTREVRKSLRSLEDAKE